MYTRSLTQQRSSYCPVQVYYAPPRLLTFASMHFNVTSPEKVIPLLGWLRKAEKSRLLFEGGRCSRTIWDQILSWSTSAFT